MYIGILGVGCVGNATAKGLERGHIIWCYDKYKQGYGTLKELADNCDVIFVTVPTPMKKSGDIDLSAIYESVGVLNEIVPERDRDNKVIIVIRSTAVSGTTDSLAKKYPKFDFAFNPEFLTARNSVQDFLNSKRVVIGANSDRVFNALEKIYRDAQFTCPIIRMDIKTSEMVKYASNVMLMSQVIVANEIYEICKHLDIDYQEIVPILKQDDRIGKMVDVPGYDNDRGAGGSCFPKDLNALIYLAREHGYRPDLLEEIWRTNLKFRKKIDWL